jgi:hypothetical protein
MQLFESNGLRKPDPHTFEPDDTGTYNVIQVGPHHGIILLMPRTATL